MMNVIYKPFCAKCRYDERRYAECRYAECLAPSLTHGITNENLQLAQIACLSLRILGRIHNLLFNLRIDPIA
jgi:hypothetical protein